MLEVLVLTKKTIDFPNEEVYREIKAEAVKEGKNIGAFIVQCFIHWKETRKKE